MRKHNTNTKRKSLSSSNQNLTTLLLGVAAGGLVGAGAALLLAPRDETSFQDNLADAYKTLSKTAKNYAKTGTTLLNTAADYAGAFKDKATELLDQADHSSATTSLIVGAIGGGILGVTTALLLSSGSAKGLRHDLRDAYEKTTDLASHWRRSPSAADRLRSVDWLNLAQTVIHTLTTGLQSGAQEIQHTFQESEEEDEEPSPFHDAVKLASLGLRLWQNVKSGR